MGQIFIHNFTWYAFLKLWMLFPSFIFRISYQDFKGEIKVCLLCSTSAVRCRFCLSCAQWALPSLRAKLESASCRVSWAACRRAWCSSACPWSLWATMALISAFRLSAVRSLALKRSRRPRISFRAASLSA